MGRPLTSPAPDVHFSEWYLKDPNCVDFVDQELGNYFRENSRSVASPVTLWAAGKTSLRGIIKEYVRQQEARQAQLINGFESRIADLEHWVKRSDGHDLRRQLALLPEEFRQASLAQVRQASTQRVYELGDKNRKLLYWLATGDPGWCHSLGTRRALYRRPADDHSYLSPITRTSMCRSLNP
ncbi:hypothetical protein NDU88_005636 [Pleurodeles waltl]|uniref:Uncharacterized protein n=1 Tax=Pleurodeles waltl TaxID=8319 RepID=A0AAV7WZ48_PLEWA|nr:hypothetical protein NDU88_005636 [Pleurodeles waltl]